MSVIQNMWFLLFSFCKNLELHAISLDFFQGPRLSCKFLKRSWAIVLRGLYMTIFIGMCLFYVYDKLPNVDLRIIQAQKRAPNSRNEPHMTNNAANNHFLTCIFRHFITSSLSQKHIFCRYISWKIPKEEIKQRPDRGIWNFCIVSVSALHWRLIRNGVSGKVAVKV